MALRKPLVVVSGQLEQLQPGDTLDAPQSGGDQVVQTNGEAGAVVIGAPVYTSANDTFLKAQANAATTEKVTGLVAQAPSIANGATGPVQTDGVLSATTAQWDAVAGTTGGLTAGSYYYLDPATSGKITATAPSTVGQYVRRLGKAISTTELLIMIEPSILL
jgi:hypothetical protein